MLALDLFWATISLAGRRAGRDRAEPGRGAPVPWRIRRRRRHAGGQGRDTAEARNAAACRAPPDGPAKRRDLSTS